MSAAEQPAIKLETPLELDQIQGNLVGFNKDCQTFLFLRFHPGRRMGTLRWLRDITGQVATATQVLTFNTTFKALRDRQPGLERTIWATWLNIAFTHDGLIALGTLPIEGFPDEFQQGMRARAREVLGDTDGSAPDRWVFPRDNGPIHALLLLAADRAADLAGEAARQSVALRAAGIELLHRQDGLTLPGAQRGNEHFGFKDGVSQPGIRDDRITPRDPGQGRDQRIAPDEFVLGAPNRSADLSTSPPAWTKNGSYLVFRRLRQDVAEFQTFVARQANDLKISEDLLRAKLIGRYPSGAPLAGFAHPTAGMREHIGDGASASDMLGWDNDPGFDPARDNDFDYRNDPDGLVVPLAAHIRKVNPRSQPIPGERSVREHRLLRRGIPFTEPDGERGLLFICYQASIAKQFEFVQRMWANVPDFPQPGQGGPPGLDPLIGQADGPREFDLPGCPGHHITSMSRWVTTTGGDYFFSPSIKALRLLAIQEGEEGDVMPDYPQRRTIFQRMADRLRPKPPQAAPYGARARTWYPLMPDYCIMPMDLDRNGTVMALGSCMVLISVAAAAQTPDIGQIPRLLEWRVIIGDREDPTVDDEVIWNSNNYTRLIVNAHGMALGSAQVPVRKLLEALAKVMPDKTIPQILEIINPDWIRRNPGKAYRHFYFQILVGKAYVDFPIDFGPGGNPGP